MTDDRLKAEFWIMAHVRRCNAEGVPATVVRRGDSRGGTLVLKINQFDRGCRVLSQAVDMDGTLGWGPVSRPAHQRASAMATIGTGSIPKRP